MIHNNEGFVCMSCKKTVGPAKGTCRNHCPYCFTSRHVDDLVPGDRASTCQGIMKPKQYIYEGGQIKILFSCTKCDHTHRNKSAEDDDIMTLIDLVSPKG